MILTDLSQTKPLDVVSFLYLSLCVPILVLNSTIALPPGALEYQDHPWSFILVLSTRLSPNIQFRPVQRRSALLRVRARTKLDLFGMNKPHRAEMKP
jgi:hypothetical protein